MLRIAKFNKDRTERYWLKRIWGDPKNCVMFIGLNPSTADDVNDDPTIRRVIRFGQDLGYGGIIMCNLFVDVTPYPDELRTDVFRNFLDAPIQSQLEYCKLYIACWGNFKEAVERGKQVSEMIKNLHCLGTNANGSPKHPLYIHSSTKPTRYNF